jgi:hypothetical protein
MVWAWGGGGARGKERQLDTEVRTVGAGIRWVEMIKEGLNFQERERKLASA